MKRPSLHPHGAALTALFHAAVFVGLLAAGGTAQAQWVWKDAAGNVTFSDVPPPPDVPPDQIVRRPGAVAITPVPAPGAAPNAAPEAPAAPGGPKASNGPKTLAEQDADFRKRREDAQKAEQKAAEEQSKAAQKQAACNQAQSYLSMIQSGMRLMRPNPDGTRGFMDDDTRSAEVQKAQEQVSQNCG